MAARREVWSAPISRTGRRGQRRARCRDHLVPGRATLIRDLSRAEAWPAEALAVTGTLIVIRIVWVFPLSAVLQRRSGTRRPSWPVPAVVSWAGARGVVPLAAALSIPLTTASGAPLPRRDLILAIATAVIVISLVVQGLTLEPLVRRAGIARSDAARHEETVARLRLTRRSAWSSANCAVAGESRVAGRSAHRRSRCSVDRGACRRLTLVIGSR
jgi:NhaP-type Na+/H+ and K+/H+ antiporter